MRPGNGQAFRAASTAARPPDPGLAGEGSLGGEAHPAGLAAGGSSSMPATSSPFPSLLSSWHIWTDKSLFLWAWCPLCPSRPTELSPPGPRTRIPPTSPPPPALISLSRLPPAPVRRPGNQQPPQPAPAGGPELMACLGFSVSSAAPVLRPHCAALQGPGRPRTSLGWIPRRLNRTN